MILFDHRTIKSRSLAKDLRKSPTDAEKALWKRLRAKQMNGLKFRRQEPIGRYIVDFVCYERNLIVEVDGGQHSRSLSDALRDGVLEVIRESTLP